MTLKIVFADLTHTAQGISSIAFPFGIGLVASYAKKILRDEVDIELFKYPEKLKDYLEKETPKMVCFSNSSWTLDLSYEFAKKIKKKYPETIIIFGGPNYPNEIDEQKKFLFFHPAIDFYIKNEGEQAFVDLFENLKKVNFNVKEFKEDNIKSGNCHYAYDGEFIKGEMLPRLENLNDIPSPYLTGIFDKFFDGVLNPVIQTIRGCPFSCAYCQESQPYFSKVTRFSPERIKKELEYIAERVNVPLLIITDSNFGMYEQDLKTCEDIAVLKEKYGWPKYIDTNLGKNKDIVSKAVSLLHGDVCLSAPIQSTNEKVLENINRRNISIEKTMEIIEENKSKEADTFSEIILALPGDTKEAHYKSMCDMMDIGINTVRSHQLLMLPASPLSNKEERQNYGMITRFRIQPRCFGTYELYGESFSSAEIDELCVANNTLSYQDYLDCRSFNLTIELFHNNGIFRELTSYLKQKGVKTSEFVRLIEKKLSESELKELYDGFLKETHDSLWTSEYELESFIKQPGKVKEYIEKELRNNEQLRYRAAAFFKEMPALHKIAFESAKEILKNKNLLDEKQEVYLDELKEFSLARKKQLLSTNLIETKEFHYDFIKLKQERFEVSPFSYFIPKGINIEFKHSEEQKQTFADFIRLFGTSMNGLGFILSRSNANKLYREVRRI